jgi:ribonuclease J
MSANRLIYLPLGGAGEIGMNCYVYGYGPAGRERLILIDLGVAFPDMDTSPGVDLILPDVSWLADKLDRLEAIFITHAHEDHIGALAHLWPQLQKKVYARRFTATIGKLKFDEAGLPKDQIVTVGARPATVEVGPFKVQFVPVSHSIPESSALVIDTPAGRIFHSADFKIDHNPVVGEAWDDARFTEIVAERPVKAMTCDSTNVFSTHEGRSESTLGPALTDLIKASSGMVVATTFGSNVARLKTLAEAARAADRTICVLGRSMKRMLSASEEAEVLSGFPKTVSPEEALEVPRRNLMLLVTGSQGERRAASAQLSRGKYLGIEMKEGDTFLFSSKTIPGNERDVLRVWNAFSEKGVQVIDDQGGKYHVSGHANRPDLEHVHRLILPDMLVPMHGEHRHLTEHVRIATEAGIAAAVAPNGTMLDLTGDVLVTVILDESDLPMGDPWAELMGLPATGKGGRPLAETLETDLAEFADRAGKKLLKDDDKLEEEIRRLVRQVAMEEIGKKPEVTVVISRLMAE